VFLFQIPSLSLLVSNYEPKRTSLSRSKTDCVFFRNPFQFHLTVEYLKPLLSNVCRICLCVSLSPFFLIILKFILYSPLGLVTYEPTLSYWILLSVSFPYLPTLYSFYFATRNTYTQVLSCPSVKCSANISKQNVIPFPSYLAFTVPIQQTRSLQIQISLRFSYIVYRELHQYPSTFHLYNLLIYKSVCVNCSCTAPATK
jgi:hypothetical protein